MTLTEVSYYSRRMAPFAVLLLLVALILFYSVRLFLIFISLNQPTSLPINPVFGKILAPVIPDATSSAGLKFTLDTVEGTPVTASDTAKIIFIPPPTPRFGYREKIYLVAKFVGFDTELIKHKFVDEEAVFEEERQKLSFDVSNFNFTYQLYFENTPEIFENASMPDRGLIENRATNFLNSMGRYSKEFSQGKTNLVYLAYNPVEKSITGVENKNQANMVEVDYYRPDIDGFPTVSPKYFNSPNFVILTFTGPESKILRAQVRFFEKSEDQIGIYPLKTGDQAYEDLKSGKGMVVSNPTEQQDISIKKMFVGYYDPEVYQEYLQPVYVFLGENNFVAYVPGITDEYLSQ